MADERFIIERPAEYTVAPTYRPVVVESHLNKYVKVIDPLSFSADRCSFSWRSPGLGVIQNSTVELSFTILVETEGQAINYVAQMGPQLSLIEIQNADQGSAFAPNGANAVAGASCKLAFGSGDAMQKSIESIQIVVNGVALQQTRQRDYMRSLQNCWFDKDVFQKRFFECGGTPQQYDCVAVQTSLNAVSAAATPNVASGFTGDSGTTDRLKNLLSVQMNAVNFGDAIATMAVAGGATVGATPANNDYRLFRVRWRVNGTGLYNPLSRGDKVSSSCPYRRSARALPHQNVVSLNILWSDLFKSLVRNLSTVSGQDGAENDAGLNISRKNGIKVSFPAGKPDAKLYVEYLRLPSWRLQDSTAVLQTYRISTHDPTSDDAPGTVVFAPELLDTGVPGYAALKGVLPCKGVDRQNGRAAQYTNAGYRDCAWSGVVASQLPQFIFCVLEKSMDMTCHSNLHDRKWGSAQAPAVLAHFPAHGGHQELLDAGRRNQYLARNSDGNASITRFSLEIMSTQGSYIYSSEKWPYIKNRADLYRDTQKYCIDSFDDCDTWFKHNCIILIGVSEFAKGISSSGTSFPCSFNVKARFENFRQFVDGFGCCSGAIQATGLGACQDVIMGRPVLGFIYPQQALQLNASSGLLSSQNISHSSAVEMLMRGAGGSRPAYSPSQPQAPKLERV